MAARAARAGTCPHRTWIQGSAGPVRLGAIVVAIAAVGVVGCSPVPPQPPDAPLLTLELGVKQLRFAWETDSAATHHQLLHAPAETAPFSVLADGLTGTSHHHDVSVHREPWDGARYALDACNTGGCSRSDELPAPPRGLGAIGYLKASNTLAEQRFGWSLALSADGGTLAVGAYAESSAATGVDGDQADETAPFAGAVYVFARQEGAWSQEAYLKASNTAAFDQFGWSVALSADGGTLAVGAPGESSAATGVGGDQDDDSAPLAGAVYVFARVAGAWSQEAYVKASNSGAGDVFGTAVALSAGGDVLAVGAPLEDSSATGVGGDEANDASVNAGAVYVFGRDAGAWAQQAYVKASNTDAGDDFGRSVALSAGGDVLAVGAPGEASGATGVNGNQADDTADDAGAVYVFARPTGSWVQVAYAKASNTEAGDQFGRSVALDAAGTALAVGAFGEDGGSAGVDGDQGDDSASEAGAAYLFAFDSGVWAQTAYLKAANPGAGHRFGWALDLAADGSTLAVGAYGEASAATGVGDVVDEASASAAGAVYLFVRDSGGWAGSTYVKAPNAGEGDLFGWALALSSDGATLAVAAAAEDGGGTGVGDDQLDDSAANAGAAYLY
jgi:trimeric autotransporter adhesin